MEDRYRHIAQYKPKWRRVDKYPPPLGGKCLFKTARGPAVIGVWYAESGWVFWCSLPAHSVEDKEYIKSLEAGAK